MCRYLTSIVLLLAFPVVSVLADELHNLRLNRPIAAVYLPGSNSLLIANQESARMVSVQLSSPEWSQSDALGSKIKGVVHIPESNSIVVATETPNRLIQMQFDSGSLSQEFTYDLELNPESIAISSDGRKICVVDRWSSKAVVLTLANDAGQKMKLESSLTLPMFPKWVCAADDGFAVSDSFDGMIAFIQRGPDGNYSAQRFDFRGHHIGGLHYDSLNRELLVTHQILSKVAQTTREDIMWGTLIQNVLRTIPISSLQATDSRLDATSRFVQLGDFGQGESDPSDLTRIGEHWYIAASGADRLIKKGIGQTQKVAVELPSFPTRLCRIRESQIAVVCPLDNQVCIVDVHSMKIEKTLGTSPEQWTAEQLGEKAFHSARLSHDRWFSCNSCHVDGHAANLLADTLGDGTYGTPKRIPSLLDNFHTAPFGWTGNKATIDDQISQTLENTMHASLDDEMKRRTVNDLRHYLATLSIPTNPIKRHAIASSEKIPNKSEMLGQQIFVDRGCVRCHDPEYSFTSRKLFDVGVRDQNGHGEFSPPTLRGVSFRRSFFHDGRFQSLDALLLQHPMQDALWETAEKTLLLDFLRESENIPKTF